MGGAAAQCICCSSPAPFSACAAIVFSKVGVGGRERIGVYLIDSRRWTSPAYYVYLCIVLCSKVYEPVVVMLWKRKF